MDNPLPTNARAWIALLSLACWVMPHSDSGVVTPVTAGRQPHDTSAWSRMGGGVAKIEYTLPKAGRVRVRVFDADGHEFARPVDEWQTAGTHHTTFAFGPSNKTQVFRYRVECGRRRREGKISVEP